LINNSFRASIAFWNCSRAFGVSINYFNLTVITIGFIIGIRNILIYEGDQSNNSLAGLYGVSVVFLIQISDNMQWFLRQIISM